MNILPYPNNNEEAIDALSFFEQIVSDYNAESGMYHDELCLIRREIVKKITMICEHKSVSISENIWNMCNMIYREISFKGIDRIDRSGIVFYAKPKIPECRSYRPIEMRDVIWNTYRQFQKYRNKSVLVVGVRTAGSWGGGIVAGALEHMKIRCNFITLRPAKIRKKTIIFQEKYVYRHGLFYLEKKESELLQEYIKQCDTVIIVDDPPSSGSTVNMVHNYFKQFEDVKNIVFFPLGNIDKKVDLDCNMPMLKCRYSPYPFRNVISSIEHIFSLTLLDIERNAYNEMIPRTVKFIFRDEITKKTYIAKYVGAGWFGKIEYEKAILFQNLFSKCKGIVDGYLIYELLSNHISVGKDKIVHSIINYHKVICDNYFFRFYNGYRLVWHSNNFRKRNWACEKKRLVRCEFDGGHWSEFINEVFLLCCLLMETNCMDEEIVLLIKKHYPVQFDFNKHLDYFCARKIDHYERIDKIEKLYQNK